MDTPDAPLTGTTSQPNAKRSTRSARRLIASTSTTASAAPNASVPASIKPWQRYVILACGVGIVLLLLVGFPLLGDRLTPLGVIALIAVLVLVIVWVVRESRRFR